MTERARPRAVHPTTARARTEADRGSCCQTRPQECDRSATRQAASAGLAQPVSPALLSLPARIFHRTERLPGFRRCRRRVNSSGSRFYTKNSLAIGIAGLGVRIDRGDDLSI